MKKMTNDSKVKHYRKLARTYEQKSDSFIKTMAKKYGNNFTKNDLTKAEYKRLIGYTVKARDYYRKVCELLGY